MLLNIGVRRTYFVTERVSFQTLGLATQKVACRYCWVTHLQDEEGEFAREA